VREQRISQNVRRPTQISEITRVGDEFDERAVKAVENVVNDVMLFGESGQ